MRLRRHALLVALALLGTKSSTDAQVQSDSQVLEAIAKLKSDLQQAVAESDFASALTIQNQINLAETMLQDGTESKGSLAQSAEAQNTDAESANIVPVLDIVADDSDKQSQENEENEEQPSNIDVGDGKDLDKDTVELGSGENKKDYSMGALLESLRKQKEKRVDHSPFLRAQNGEAGSQEEREEAPDDDVAPLPGNVPDGVDEESAGLDHASSDSNPPQGVDAMKQWLANNAQALFDDDSDGDASVQSSGSDADSQPSVVNGAETAPDDEVAAAVDENVLSSQDSVFAEQEQFLPQSQEDATLDIEPLDIEHLDIQPSDIVVDAEHENANPARNNPTDRSDNDSGQGTDPCSDSSVDCTGHGSCVSGEVSGIAECSCDSGWTGSRCDEDLDDCAADPCSDHGTCRDIGTNAFLCSCEVGWSGATCQEHDPCLLKPCGHHGVCDTLSVPNARGDMFDCSCHSGWTGPACNVDVDDCADNPCHSHGTCHDTGTDSYFCDCVPGWTGSSCDEQPACASEPCGLHGTCVEDETSADGFGCQCDAGWTGGICNIDIDDCAQPPEGSSGCSEHGTCRDIGTLSFLCDCAVGWSGTLCEDPVQSAASWQAKLEEGQQHEEAQQQQQQPQHQHQQQQQSQQPAPQANNFRPPENVAIGANKAPSPASNIQPHDTGLGQPGLLDNDVAANIQDQAEPVVDTASKFIEKLQNHGQPRGDDIDSGVAGANHWADLNGGAVGGSSNVDTNDSSPPNSGNALRNAVSGRQPSAAPPAIDPSNDSGHGTVEWEGDQEPWSVKSILMQPTVLGGLGILVLVAGLYVFCMKRGRGLIDANDSDDAASTVVQMGKVYERVNSRNSPGKLGSSDSDSDGDGEHAERRSLRFGVGQQSDEGGDHENSDENDDGFNTDSTGGWGDGGLIDIPLDEEAEARKAAEEAAAAAERQRREKEQAERREKQRLRREEQQRRRERMRREREERRLQREAPQQRQQTKEPETSAEQSTPTSVPMRHQSKPNSSLSGGVGAGLVSSTASRPKPAVKPEPEPSTEVDYFGAMGISMDTSTVKFSQPAVPTTTARSMNAGSQLPEPSTSSLFAAPPVQPNSGIGSLAASATGVNESAGAAAGWGDDDSWEDSTGDSDASQ